MTILEAITECVGALSTKTRLEFADLDEANATIFDKLKQGDSPVCLIIPFDIVDPDRANGIVNSTAEINAIFLSRFDSQSTTDKSSLDIENDIISPMRTLSRELINRLDDHDIITKDGITAVTHRSIHQSLMDATWYGNWAVFTIQFTEDNSTCPPHANTNT